MALSIAYWRQNAVTPQQQQKHLAACSLERGGVPLGSFQGYSTGAKIGLDFRKDTMRRFKKGKRPGDTGRLALHGPWTSRSRLDALLGMV